jgi:hypothetical protein
MTRQFFELEVNEIRAAIESHGARIGVALLCEGFMPEADVLLCRVNDRPFNVQCDLAYGSEVVFHGPASRAEVAALEAALLGLCEPR